MKKPKHILIFVVALIIVIILLFLSWKTHTRNEREVLDSQVEIGQQGAENQRVGISMSIEGFTENELSFKIEKSSTIFDVLEIVDMSNPELGLEYSEYESMGVLVEQLGNKINGDNNKYWQYYVNGEQPMISADSYVLQDGDRVEWIFKESEF